MQKYNKFYRYISIANLCLHLLLFLFILYSSFLPFHGDENFYRVISDFFGTGVISKAVPYIMLLLQATACVLCFMSISRPVLFIGTAVLDFAFFLIMEMPYFLEAAFVGLTSSWIDSNMSEYGIGYQLMNFAAFFIYIDFAFALYAIVTAVIRASRAGKTQVV